MSFVSTNDTVKIKMGNFDITNSKSEKVLGTMNSLSMITFQNDVRLVEKLMHCQE